MAAVARRLVQRVQFMQVMLEALMLEVAAVDLEDPQLLTVLQVVILVIIQVTLAVPVALMVEEAAAVQ